MTLNRASKIFLAGLALAAASPALADDDHGSGDRFNRPGNVLISDQFNNRVIEVAPDKQIVWQFGSGDPNLCNPGPGAIIAPNDVERLAFGLTLIAGTGTSTCADNRVIVVDREGNIVWQYGQAGVAGSGPNELSTPVFALQTPFGQFLITDQANNRIIQVDLAKNITFSYGPTSGPSALNSPNSAELLRNGHILIADENNNRVLEIDASGNIVSQITNGLNVVAFASRLRNGDTLIADAGNNRVVEVTPGGATLFQYLTNTQLGSNANPNPTSAVRLRNHDTLIADQFNDRVIRIDRGGNIRWQYGMLNTVGNGPDQLNAPYNAMVIGDYTGVTPPLFFHGDDE